MLTLSRAARLIGVSRGSLQKKIRDGELKSFEGLIDPAELSRAYPQADLEDNAMLERIEHIIENALRRARGAKVRKLLTPNLGTLAARVAALSRELSRVLQRNRRLEGAIEGIADELRALEHRAPGDIEIGVLRERLLMLLREPYEGEAADSVLAHDRLLRVMAAQVHLMPSGHEFFVEGDNSLLSAGLSAGLALEYGCSNGNCGTCKARLISGDVEKIAAHDYVIPEAEKLQGYILMCCHTAVSDVVLEAHEATDESELPMQRITTRVRRVERRSPDMAILHLRTPRTDRLRFLSGQRALLQVEGVEAQEYSIASCPCDDMNLQFHIPRNEEQPFARYVFDDAQPSHSVGVEGPRGHFVLDTESTRPLLFVAIDDGFAPIKGLIEHAMTLGAAESIHLYWIGSGPQPHYLDNLCRSWLDAFDNFRYTPIVIGEHGDSARLQAALRRLGDEHRDLGGYDAFVAGGHAGVEQVGRALLELGLPETRLRREVMGG
jgi:CDP-4-dehydro-6-deoxyglucose reductase